MSSSSVFVANSLLSGVKGVSLRQSFNTKTATTNNNVNTARVTTITTTNNNKNNTSAV